MRLYTPSNPDHPPSSRWIFTELKKIAQIIKEIVNPEDWKDVATYSVSGFQNSWDDVGGATDEPASFYKDASGRVYLRGLIDTGASGSVAFTLPVGYRPEYDARFVCDTVSGGGGSGGHAGVVISTSGTVTVTMSGTSTDVSLSNISFRI